MRASGRAMPVVMRCCGLALILGLGFASVGAGKAEEALVATPTATCDLVPIDTHRMLLTAGEDTPSPFDGGTVRDWDDGGIVWVDGTSWIDGGGYFARVPPPGSPASATVEDGVAATVAEWQRCWREGHGDQLFRLLSAQGLQWLKTIPAGLWYADPAIAYLSWFSPSFASIPSDVSYSLTQVRVLSDGRAIAVVDPNPTESDTWMRLLWVFSPGEDGWRVDRVMGPFVEMPFPSAAATAEAAGLPEAAATPSVACPVPPADEVIVAKDPTAPAVLAAGDVRESNDHPPMVRVDGRIWALDGVIEAGVAPGQPAPLAVRAGVAATVAAWTICWNAGQGERLFGLLSEDGREWVGYAPPWLLDDDPTVSYLTRGDASLPTPLGTPLAYRITLMRILSGDRALVLIDPYPQFRGTMSRLLWVLSPEADGWRVDRVVGMLVELPGSIVVDAPEA